MKLLLGGFGMGSSDAFGVEQAGIFNRQGDGNAKVAHQVEAASRGFFLAALENAQDADALAFGRKGEGRMKLDCFFAQRFAGGERVAGGIVPHDERLSGVNALPAEAIPDFEGVF